MAFTGPARITGAVFVLFGLLASAFMLLAWGFGAGDAAVRFGLVAGYGVFLGGALIIAARGRAMRGGTREGVLFITFGWFALAALTCAPLAQGGTPDWGRAYFDALSALTTTGFTPAVAATPPDGGIDRTVTLAWWHTLQWVGGLLSITCALVVLAALNLTGPGIHRSTLFTLRQDALFDRFAPVSRAVAALYTGATGVIWLGLWTMGAQPLDAWFTAQAAVSSGGLAGAQAGLSAPAIGLAVFALAIGASNFALHWDTARGRAARHYVADGETRAIVAFFVLALMAGWLVAGSWRGGAEAVSIAATGGWDLGGGVFALGTPTLLALALIGGSPISAAGGLKVLRLTLLFSYVGAELRRLAHPSSVFDVSYRDRRLASNIVLGLLLYAFGYTAAAGAITLLVAGGLTDGSAAAVALSGPGLEDALALSVAALANAGPVAGLALGPDGAPGLNTAIGQGAVRMWLCVAMVLGRVEVLALFALALPGFWRR